MTLINGLRITVLKIAERLQNGLVNVHFVGRKFPDTDEQVVMIRHEAIRFELYELAQVFFHSAGEVEVVVEVLEKEFLRNSVVENVIMPVGQEKGFVIIHTYRA